MREIANGVARTVAAGLLLSVFVASGASERQAIIAPLASRSLLLDGTTAGDALVVVGERGHVLVSRDGGSSWEQKPAPTRATLTGIHFHDGELGWAVGHDAVILRTRDGGASWQRVHHAPEEERPLLDVWFRDAETGFAVGAYGFFLVTTDGGKTWIERELELGHDDVDAHEEFFDFHLNHISRSGTGRLYLAAEAGTILRSDDDGATWKRLASPYEGSFFGTLPLDGDTVLLFGLRGNLFRSEDAGETWTRVSVSTDAMLTSGLHLQDGRCLIVGLAGTMLFSSDGGRTFKTEAQADRQGLAAAIETSDGGLVLVGEFGVKRVAKSEP